MEKNSIGNIHSIEIKGNPVVKSENSIFAESFYFNGLYDENLYKKFIKNTEKLIRNSIEYKNYIELLRTNLTALNLDNILSNITTDDAELEFHHYPFSLYEIVDIVTTARYIKDQKVTSFAIAKEVMELHYKNQIGLVPLSITNHELAHNGNLFISTKQVFGNYSVFISNFTNIIPTILKDRVKKIEELTEKDIPSDLGGLL